MTEEYVFENLVRPNIKSLKPYRCARDDYSDGTLLDANENAFGHTSGPEFSYNLDLNRYPDPHQSQLKSLLAKYRSRSMDEIFIGNGSDEVIDLLIRVLCVPGKDNIIVCPPTYGMYSVSAKVNDVHVKTVPLTQDFELQPKRVLEAVDACTKVIFVCSPNNPTANAIHRQHIKTVLEKFQNGVVVVDEAYIDFCENAAQETFCNEISQYPNLVVSQTLSKAFGLAGIRVGSAFANKDIIEVMNRAKPPYNVSKLNSMAAIKSMENPNNAHDKIAKSNIEKKCLIERLSKVFGVVKIYPSQTNFVLVKFKSNAYEIYKHMAEELSVVVRYRGDNLHCEECLRITVGTRQENDILLESLVSSIGLCMK